MKKIFSILLILSVATFAYANDNNPPTFKETDESCIGLKLPFAADEPIFEEDDDGDESGETSDNDENDSIIAYTPNGSILFGGKCDEDGDGCGCFKNKGDDAHYISWTRYKANFGMEKVFVRFPQKPGLSQTSNALTAYAFDHVVSYSFTGYFPPMGNIAAGYWFDEVINMISQYPFVCLSHVIFQTEWGDWILDYVAHDYVKDNIIKARAIVTPFNAYTIQCVKPNGVRDHFDYFLDSFYIKCECGE